MKKLLYLLLFLPLWAIGQSPYAVDTSFYTYRSILRHNFYPDDFIVQSDGKLVVVGRAEWTLDGKSSRGAVRLFPDGTVDTSFRMNLNFDSYKKIFQLPNNEFLISRIEYGSGANTTSFGLSAVSSNGTLINRYQVSYRTFPYSIEKVALQSDGKLLIAGNTLFELGYNDNILRINPDGQKDSTFQVDFPDSTSIFIYSLELLENGKILVGGNFRRVNGVNCFGFVRLNSDGSTDTSFNPQVSFVTSIQKIGENQFVTVARNTAGNSPTIKFINSDGEIIDTTFRMQTFRINFTHLNSVQKLFNGKYLCIGTVAFDNHLPINSITFFDQNGVLDTSYTHQELPSARGRFRPDKIVATETGTYLIGNYGYYENSLTPFYLFKINGFRCGQEQAGNITVSDTSRTCLGTTTTLTAPPAASYLWSNGETTQSIDAFLPGNYTVRLATPSGCLGIASAPVTINRTNSFCENDILYNNSDTLTSRLSAESYRWFHFGGFLEGNDYNRRSIPIRYDGVYTLIVRIGSFTDTSQYIISSLAGSIVAKEVKIYPNPSSGKVNIQTKQTALGYSITDLTGKVISKETGNYSQIDISHLQHGVYQLHLQFNEGTVVKAIVKQ